MKNEIRYQRQILRQLNTALKEINGVLSNIYDKYAKNGKLTLAEMTKYNRYRSMEKEIFLIIGDATKANLHTIDKMLPAQYNESFFNYGWAMDNANGVRLNYGVVNKDILVQLNKNPWLVSAKERYLIAGKTQMRNALNNGLALGKSYPQMYKDIKKGVGILKGAIIQTLRTEGQSVVNAGQADLYARAKAKGINGEEKWLTAKDSKVRPTKKGDKGNHKEMDGKKKNKDGMYYLPFTGEKAPFPVWPGLSAGQRINCRCEARFEVTGYAPQIMRTRELGVIPYQPYEEYRETYFNKDGSLKKDYANIVRKQYEGMK